MDAQQPGAISIADRAHRRWRVGEPRPNGTDGTQRWRIQQQKPRRPERHDDRQSWTDVVCQQQPRQALVLRLRLHQQWHEQLQVVHQPRRNRGDAQQCAMHRRRHQRKHVDRNQPGTAHARNRPDYGQHPDHDAGESAPQRRYQLRRLPAGRHRHHHLCHRQGQPKVVWNGRGGYLSHWQRQHIAAATLHGQQQPSPIRQHPGAGPRREKR